MPEDTIFQEEEGRVKKLKLGGVEWSSSCLRSTLDKIVLKLEIFLQDVNFAEDINICILKLL